MSRVPALRSRREFFVGAAAIGVSAALPASAAFAKNRRPPILLVHGAWHGGWCWQRVLDRLTAKGRTVFAPTLSGVGERSHLASDAITLSTHIDDIVNEMKWKDLDHVVVVGHSYGGIVITGVALTETLHVTDAYQTIREKLYVRTPAFPQPAFDDAYARCRANHEWKTAEMTCGHDLMIDRPAEVAKMIDSLAT